MYRNNFGNFHCANGGNGSILPRKGSIESLLDATREQLRDWLRKEHPGKADCELWRDDATNESGENFRSRVRMQLMPVLRELRPGFERPLAQTMDLIAAEDEMLEQQAESIVYRSVRWDGKTAHYSAGALCQLERPLARRVLRICLLMVNPDARLEAAQIERILEHAADERYTTETSGGIRVLIADGALTMRICQ